MGVEDYEEFVGSTKTETVDGVRPAICDSPGFSGSFRDKNPKSQA